MSEGQPEQAEGDAPPGAGSIFSPDLEDPYALYRALRPRRSRWDALAGAWQLLAYEDVLAALRDPRLVCPVTPPPAHLPAHLAPVERELRTLSRFRSLALMHRNGADHTRLRHLIQPLFAPAAIARLRPHVAALADSLLDRVAGHGRMDAMMDFAYPLTTAANARLVGIPPEDVPDFAGWSTAAFHGWPEVAEGEDPAATVRESYACLRRVAAYVTALAERRRTRPGDDLVSRLARAVEAGTLSRVEMVVNVAFLFETGRHSTAHFLGTAMLSLLDHPEQAALLRERPDLIPQAVEELLRFDPPSVTVGRVAVRALEAGGAGIGAGEPVMPLLGAANRDPARFTEPDRLDIGRREGAHLAFGAGPHFCPGAPLGRMEAVVAVGTLLRRLPGLRHAAEPPVWRSHPAIRVLRSLPVAWEREEISGP